MYLHSCLCHCEQAPSCAAITYSVAHTLFFALPFYQEPKTINFNISRWQSHPLLHPSFCHCEPAKGRCGNLILCRPHSFLYLCILIYLFICIFLLIFESVIANLPKAGVAITYSSPTLFSLHLPFYQKPKTINQKHYTNIYSHNKCLKSFKIGNNSKWL